MPDQVTPRYDQLVALWRRDDRESLNAFQAQIIDDLSNRRIWGERWLHLLDRLQDDEIWRFMSDIENIASEVGIQFTSKGQSGAAVGRLVAIPISGLQSSVEALVDDPEQMAALAEAARASGYVGGTGRMVLYPHLVTPTDLIALTPSELFEATRFGLQSGLSGKTDGGEALSLLQQVSQGRVPDTDPAVTMVNQAILGVEIQVEGLGETEAFGALAVLRGAKEVQCDVELIDAARDRWHQLVQDVVADPHLGVFPPVPWGGLRSTLMELHVDAQLTMILAASGMDIRPDQCEVSLTVEGPEMRLAFAYEGQFLTEVTLHQALLAGEVDDFMEWVRDSFRLRKPDETPVSVPTRH